jgi:cation-transporting P-type ATPase 13A2
MRHLYENRASHGYLYRAVLARANVFARMAPDDKAMLVASYQNAFLDQKIGMCGDGANDCAALKQADAGISLSQAEASIAAPFTCAKPDIECVPELLIQGKSALSTAFQIAKFTITYAMIQWLQILLLYYIGMSMTNNGFLYEDLMALIPFAIFQSFTPAWHKLTKDLPTESLFYGPQVLSIFG